jgi:hypothetical protein
MRKGLSRVVSFQEMKSGKRVGVQKLLRDAKVREDNARYDARVQQEKVAPLGVIRS